MQQAPSLVFGERFERLVKALSNCLKSDLPFELKLIFLISHFI